MTNPTPLKVAVGVVLNAQQQVLIALRPEHVHQGALWEFPGGKIEVGETLEQALIRELQEEIGITPTAIRRFLKVQHDYTDKSVQLNVCWVDSFKGTASGKEGQQVRWVALEDLKNYTFPKANQAILSAVYATK